jgi:hypothetical protein
MTTPLPRRLAHTALCAAIPLLFILQGLHATALTTHPSLAARPGTQSPAAIPAWNELSPDRQTQLTLQASHIVHAWPDDARTAWTTATGAPPDILPSLLPILYESMRGPLVQELSQGHPLTPAHFDHAFHDTVATLARLLPNGRLPADAHAAVLPLAIPADPATLPTLPYALAATPQPQALHPASPHAACAVGDPLSTVLAVVYCTVLPIASVLVWLLFVPVFLAISTLSPYLAPMFDYLQLDEDDDRIGDEYARQYTQVIRNTLLDPDADGLNNVGEFRWLLNPAIADTDGDLWNDGSEVHYWNNPANDAVIANPSLEGIALLDPDHTVDTDHDNLTNAQDPDSDGDGLPDGPEALAYGSYPEFPDSDCAANATQCTPVAQTTYYDAHRAGNPGTGDGVSDGAEREAWNSLGPSAWSTDFDHDGIADNLLDPDADGDGLLDGQEFLLGSGEVRADVKDTDGDGVPDGAEVAWNVDADLDGHVNANDTDSDNDGMPDGWETAHHFNMVDPTDAALDRDGDGLSNRGEFQHATDPNNPDSEGDRLLDGEEVNTYHTDPLYWDTDRDGMPDYFETQHSLNPLSPGDASTDADGDSFDINSDGVPEQAWPNLAEYRYGRPATYNEASTGPWLLGTNPQDLDSDDDGAPDGYEVYYGTNPVLPADGNSDWDKDGLNFTDEVRHGTSPNDPDTDGDGLCDGGRAANCHYPGLVGNPGNQPGERDYGSTPWMTDSDGDGIPDGQEAVLWDPGASGQAQDVDGDLLNGLIDSDSDNDGLSDGVERDVRHTDMRLADTDKDQLKDGEEITDYGTDPLDSDTDNDGLLDGAEVAVHHTRPLVADTDGDGLSDGMEVNTYSTDPLSTDTDQDGLPDAWEILMGTQARVSDASQDPDADNLSNAYEYAINTNPRNSDSDGDGLPDEYEDKYDLDPVHNTASSDADSDGYSNLSEYTAKTDPRAWDTDGDGLGDGAEVNTFATDPLAVDSDRDGLGDGDELAQWNTLGATAWSTNYDGDAFTNNLVDSDSDNDQLSDLYEFSTSHTNPRASDTDGDGLSDYQEVMVYQSQYDAKMWDTDGDGQSDGVEVALMDTNGDFDRDGITNGDEGSVYGTDPTKEDSDCDGIRDGAELHYWGASWNSGVNRLLTADVDGDGLKDAVEIGSMDPPQGLFTRSNPALADTDGDGLNDNLEAHNNATTGCNGVDTGHSTLNPALTAAASGLLRRAALGVQPTGGSDGGGGKAAAPAQRFVALPDPVAGPDLLLVARDPTLASRLVEGVLYRGGDGHLYGMDSDGLYVQGGYGIRLYLNVTAPLGAGVKEGAPLHSNGVPMVPQKPPGLYQTKTAGTNGVLTDPLNPDTDGDHLLDGLEVNTVHSNPTLCDTDGDGLGDALERGVWGYTLDRNNACTHLDVDTSTTTDPNNPDTDGDGLTDGQEDPSTSRNGWADFTMDSWGYAAIIGETNPADADTDDDGISDLDEINGKNTVSPSLSRGIPTLPFNFDSDRDGLSDGLELGVHSYDRSAGTNLAREVNVFGHVIKTFQAYQGTGGSLLIPYSGSGDSSTTRDFDQDGIIDGLEDWNPNGLYNENAYELDPTNKDVDGDGLMDGRELRIYGSYNFPTILQAWGGSGEQLRFDPSNPLETKAHRGDGQNTDSGTDNVPDGQDLNPRADALLKLRLTNFQIQEEADVNCCGGGPWDVDLALHIQVDLPGVSGEFYKIDTAEIPNLYARSPISPDLTGRVQNTHRPGTLALASAAVNVLQFDLLDDISAAGLDLSNLAIRVTAGGVDKDACSWCSTDDVLDFNWNEGQDDFTQASTLNGEGATNPNLNDAASMVWGLPERHAGREAWNEHDVDSILDLEIGDNVQSYFVSGLIAARSGTAPPPSGTCLGTLAGTPTCPSV